jgi:hypothetical protein
LLLRCVHKAIMSLSANFLPALAATSLGLSIWLVEANPHDLRLLKIQAISPARATVDLPICYMQTTDNQMVDLTQLCEPGPGTVTIKRLTYNSNLVLGQVENQSQQTAHGVRVSYQVVGKNRSLIEENSVEVIPSTLAPGAIATFETVLPARSRLQNTRVVWSDRLQ